MSSLKKISNEDVANTKEILLIRNLECPICNMIPLEQQSYVCKKCETLYCKDCLDLWKKNNSSCPMRCIPFDFSPIENTVLYQQLMKIRLKCKNEANGCTEKPYYKDLSHHQNHCFYNQVECCKCNEYISEGNMINHLIESCSGMSLSCFICSSRHQVISMYSHIKSCIEENNFQCKTCSDYHSSIGNDFSNETCQLSICECSKCGLPDIQSSIEKSDHVCVNTNKSIVNKERMYMINTYLLELTNKIEASIERKGIHRREAFKSFMNDINIMINYIKNKVNSKFIIVKMKEMKVFDESNKRLNTRIGYLVSENSKLKDKNNSLKKAIEQVSLLIFSVKDEYSHGKERMIQEFELVKSRKESKGCQLRRIFIGIHNDLQYYKSYKSYNTLANKEENNGNMSNKQEKQEKQEEKVRQTNKVKEVNEGNQKKNQLEECYFNSQIQMTTQNRKESKERKETKSKSEVHISNPMTSSLIIKCTICGKVPHIKVPHKKCNYINCSNFFCSDCYQRNFFQVRDVNKNCDYFNCELCQNKKICIMTSLYCNQCDKRVCMKCFRRVHSSHNNIVFSD